MADNLTKIKTLALVSLGSVLEYYDFAIFIYLAPLIGKDLIPVHNPQLNLILSYAIFAISALIRPFGGMFFGHIGDTKSRNRTFVYTILTIAIPTTLIAFIPNQNQIGILAMILLIIFRIIQGFAIGGEIPGAVVFGYESSNKKYRPLGSAFVIMGTNVGFLVASAICAIIIGSNLTHGWRIAFIIGGVFGIISYFLRKSLSESQVFIDYQNSLEYKPGIPLKQLLKTHKKITLALLGLAIFLASALALYTFYMPVYLSTFYNFSLAKLMQFNSYIVLIFILGSLVAGVFHNWFGRKFFIGLITLFSLATLVIFKQYPNLSLDQIFTLHIVLLLILGALCGRIPVLCASNYPIGVRFSGVTLVYNIAFGVVAGSTQMILSWLIKITGSTYIPALYLLAFGIVGLCGVYSMKDSMFENYPD